MRCSTRVVAAVGALVAGSGSIVGEAFLVSPPASFHSPVAHGQNNDNKLRFAGGNARCLTVPALATPLPKASWRQKTLLRCSATPMRNIFTFGTKSFASRESRRYPYRRPRSAATATPSMSSSSEYGGLRQRNPLRRDDAERARLNEFITILVKTPVPEWKPALFEEYLPSLLKGNLYKQTMLEMLAKVRSGEEHETLSNVDAYLSGFLSQEKRKASRKMVSIVLKAATEGPAELDEVVQIMMKEDLIDSDLKDYLDSLITTEENRGVKSTLLKVLKTVRDRIQAERKTGSRPEVRALARALEIDDGKERMEYLKGAFTRLEDLDEFVKFVEEGIEYLGNDFGFAVKTNMPQAHFDKMKAIYAQAASIRRSAMQ